MTFKSVARRRDARYLAEFVAIDLSVAKPLGPPAAHVSMMLLDRSECNDRVPEASDCVRTKTEYFIFAFFFRLYFIGLQLHSVPRIDQRRRREALPLLPLKFSNSTEPLTRAKNIDRLALKP